MKKRVLGFVLVGFMSVLPIVSACEPAMTHSIDGKVDCVSCHGLNGVKPYPKFHADRGYTNSVCTSCHRATAG